MKRPKITAIKQINPLYCATFWNNDEWRMRFSFGTLVIENNNIIGEAVAEKQI